MREWSVFNSWRCNGCPHVRGESKSGPVGLVAGLQMQLSLKQSVQSCGITLQDHFHAVTYNELILPYAPADADSANQVMAFFCRKAPDLLGKEEYHAATASASRLRDLFQEKFGKKVPLLIADCAHPSSPFSLR